MCTGFRQPLTGGMACLPPPASPGFTIGSPSIVRRLDKRLLSAAKCPNAHHAEEKKCRMDRLRLKRPGGGRGVAVFGVGGLKLTPLFRAKGRRGGLTAAVANGVACTISAAFLDGAQFDYRRPRSIKQKAASRGARLVRQAMLRCGHFPTEMRRNIRPTWSTAGRDESRARARGPAKGPATRHQRFCRLQKGAAAGLPGCITA